MANGTGLPVNALLFFGRVCLFTMTQTGLFHLAFLDLEFVNRASGPGFSTTCCHGHLSHARLIDLAASIFILGPTFRFVGSAMEWSFFVPEM